MEATSARKEAAGDAVGVQPLKRRKRLGLIVGGAEAVKCDCRGWLVCH